ncbi:hypothetical protein [Haladaptatus halobius]|uniref:hypothetical protein n=1 Tax=Haladaptatus halobius TaxID=2884875 RepID=UPI001D0B0772|nr:hypothetical protein [Haladaptatus halobius]
MSLDTDRDTDSRISTDKETIQRWAEKHEAVPVEDTASREETERFHIIPEENVGDAHKQVEWESFFEMLEDWGYVVIYHDEEGAEPFEVVKRNKAIAHVDVDRDEFEDQLLAGNPVTSTVTETTVVESVLVEETTIESELVEREIIDQRVRDVELIGRKCASCNLVADPDIDEQGWFDLDRFLEMHDGMGDESGQPTTEEFAADEIPYRPRIDVEETWLVTRELVEQFTVESHIEDMEIKESDTTEDHDLDVSGLHRKIAESGLLDVDRSPNEVMTEFDIESEIDKDDRISTHFERERVVQDEVVDRKRLYTDVTDGDLLEMETIRRRDIETELVGDEEFVDERDESTEAEEPEEEVTEESDKMTDAEGDEPTEREEGEDTQELEETGIGERNDPTEAAEGKEVEELEGTQGSESNEQDETTTPVSLTDDEIGKTVVNASEEPIGEITEVEATEAKVYVDAHPSITDRIRTRFNWGDGDQGDLSVQADQIDRITDEQIELKEREEL